MEQTKNTWIHPDMLKIFPELKNHCLKPNNQYIEKACRNLQMILFTAVNYDNHKNNYHFDQTFTGPHQVTSENIRNNMSMLIWADGDLLEKIEHVNMCSEFEEEVMGYIKTL